MLRLLDDNTCEHGQQGALMLASVPYVRGCEHCIRQQFAEALEMTLKSLAKYQADQKHDSQQLPDVQTPA